MKKGMQNGYVLGSLVKGWRTQSHQSKFLLPIFRRDFDAIVVYPEGWARVSDGDIEGEVVVESVVVSVEIELGHRRIGDCYFELGRSREDDYECYDSG